MNLERLSRAQRRSVALAMLMVVVVCTVGVVVVPYSMLVGHFDAKLQLLSKNVALQRAIVRDGESAREQQRQLERIEAANGFFLASDKPALAAAELQRRVKQVIEQSGGTVVSSQMLGEKKEQGVGQVVLRVQMRCGVESLQKVLHTLEAQSPILLLDNILLGARPAGSIVPGRAKEGQQQLDVRFDVAAFRQGTDAPGVAASKRLQGQGAQRAFAD